MTDLPNEVISAEKICLAVSLIHVKIKTKQLFNPQPQHFIFLNTDRT